MPKALKCRTNPTTDLNGLVLLRQHLAHGLQGLPVLLLGGVQARLQGLQLQVLLAQAGSQLLDLLVTVHQLLLELLAQGLGGERKKKLKKAAVGRFCSTALHYPSVDGS